MGPLTNLHVLRWAGVFNQEEAAHAVVRNCADETVVPPGLRRRMGRLERNACRCALSVMDGASGDDIVFCSRYGNLETLFALLCSIANRELLSPMAFSGSVHNAAPGLVGQIRHQRTSHTAVAAGPDTLAMGLLETYARLASNSCAGVTLIYSELPLPDMFSEFDKEVLCSLAFAVRLGLTSLSADQNARPIRIAPGWNGARDFFQDLDGGGTLVPIGALQCPSAATC